MPEHIPKVQEIGATSAPLMSAAYFIGDRCRAFNDDYMKCKAEANGRGELECLKEGRKVTRCAASVYDSLSCCSWCLCAWLISVGSRISTPTASSSSMPTGSVWRIITIVCSSVAARR